MRSNADTTAALPIKNWHTLRSVRPCLPLLFSFQTRCGLLARFVVMVAGKPATNSLVLKSQQTGTLPSGGSVHVSFTFNATSVGRWTHDLAVRNLGNKHDQASASL